MRLILWACVVVMMASIAGAEEKPERWEGKVLRFRTQEEVDDHWKIYRGYKIIKDRLWLEPRSTLTTKAKFGEPVMLDALLVGDGGNAQITVGNRSFTTKAVNGREAVQVVWKGRKITWTFRGETKDVMLSASDAEMVRQLRIACPEESPSPVAVEAVKISGEPQQ